MQTNLTGTSAYTNSKAKWSLVLALITVGSTVVLGMANDPGSLGFAVSSLQKVLLLDLGIIAAIVLGHIAVGQIRKSAGAEKGKALALTSLVLSYAFVLILGFYTAISVHDVLTRRTAENESWGISTIHSLVTAQNTAAIQLSEAHCDLGELEKLGLIDSETARGAKHGYQFKLTCPKPAGGVVTEPRYEVLATPIRPGETGEKAFCSGPSGLVRYVPDLKSPCDVNSSQAVERR